MRRKLQYTLAVLALAGSLQAGEVVVYNLRPGATNISATLAYPVGVTRFDLTSAPASLLEALQTDLGLTLDTSWHYEADVQASGALSVQGSPGQNYWGAFAAGMGVGFMWYGFGWVLRLTKRIPDSTNY